MLRVLPTTNQTYLATKQVVAVCETLLQEVESRSNFCNNIFAFYWPNTKFYIIRNIPATFNNLICCNICLFGWLFFTAFTAEQRKRDRRRFGQADVDKDGGLSRDELISMFHPEENPHMFTVIVNVRFRYLCVFLLAINNWSCWLCQRCNSESRELFSLLTNFLLSLYDPPASYSLFSTLFSLTKQKVLLYWRSRNCTFFRPQNSTSFKLCIILL